MAAVAVVEDFDVLKDSMAGSGTGLKEGVLEQPPFQGVKSFLPRRYPCTSRLSSICALPDDPHSGLVAAMAAMSLEGTTLICAGLVGGYALTLSGRLTRLGQDQVPSFPRAAGAGET